MVELNGNNAKKQESEKDVNDGLHADEELPMNKTSQTPLQKLTILPISSPLQTRKKKQNRK